MERNKRVIIIGAGVAGMTAAMHAIKKGYTVSIFEKTNHIGGRCYSFYDAENYKLIMEQTGVSNRHFFSIDNGQHLISYSYKYFLELLDWLGTRKLLANKNNLNINCIDVEYDRCYSIGFDKNKFGFLRGILEIKYVSIIDKCRLVYFISYLLKNREQLVDCTVLEVCQRLKLSDYIIKRLLEPIVLSVMNSPIDVAPVCLFTEVLLSAKDTNFVLTHCKKTFTVLFKTFEKKINRIEGCGLYLQTLVRGFDVKGKECKGIILSNGKRSQADAVISTIASNCYKYTNKYRDIEQSFPTSTILAAYFWTSEQLDLEQEYNAIIGTNIQWIFDMNTDKNIETNIFQYRIIISNFHKFENDVVENTTILIEEELEKIFKKKIPLYRIKIINQKNATPLITNTNYKLRPSTQSYIKNLYLAGDWTNTGLPACIESAAKSGYMAIEAISKNNI